MNNIIKLNQKEIIKVAGGSVSCFCHFENEMVDTNKVLIFTGGNCADYCQYLKEKKLKLMKEAFSPWKSEFLKCPANLRQKPIYSNETVVISPMLDPNKKFEL